LNSVIFGVFFISLIKNKFYNMKQLLLILMIPIFFCSGVWAQCPGDDIILTSQSQIDSFVLNYPECTELVGDLRIITDSDADNLDGLSVITAVTGNLMIMDNHNLNALTGLQNLSAVGTLLIEDNESLTDLSALENLSSIGEIFPFYGSGGVIIRGNIGLTTLNGLQGISSVDYLIIDGNTNLTTLAALENINSINASGNYPFPALFGDLHIHNNDNLTNLTGLENINSLEVLSIIGNINLTSIGALDNIASNQIAYLKIFSNPVLSACALPNICTYLVNGGFHEIHDNAPDCNSLSEIEKICIIAFPVEMATPLQVRLQNQTAVLTWRTETESNNAGFEIQRSRDGIQWQRIGWQNGQGNSLSSYSYTYTDESPFLGTSYYRLKQVDFDGDFDYSGTVSLRYAPRQVIIYPNPVQDKLFIQTESSLQELLIYDALGKLLKTSIDNNTINVSTFAKGIYTLKITIEGEDFYEKILVK